MDACTGVDVSIRREIVIAVAQPSLDVFHCVAQVEHNRGTAVPLRYIYDNTEKSSNCNGFTFFTPLFRPLFQR